MKKIALVAALMSFAAASFAQPAGQPFEGQGRRWRPSPEEMAAKEIVVTTEFVSKKEAKLALTEILENEDYTIEQATGSLVYAVKKMKRGQRGQGRPEGAPEGGMPQGGRPQGGPGGMGPGGRPQGGPGGMGPGGSGMGPGGRFQMPSQTVIDAKICGNANKGGIVIKFRMPSLDEEGKPVFNESGRIVKMLPVTHVEYIPRKK